MSLIQHDEKHSELVAGWFHLGFAAMYVAAFFWHLKGARDHFRREQK